MSSPFRRKRQESWKRSCPAFDNPDQQYAMDKFPFAAKSLNKHECKVQLPHVSVELAMAEKENVIASDETVKPNLYKSVQEQCDRILHLLNRNRTELKDKGVSPGPCDTDKVQDLGTTSSKNSGVEDTRISVGFCAEEYEDGESSNQGDGEGAGCDRYVGVEVDSLVWEEADWNQDEDQDMNVTEFLLGQDLVDGDQVDQRDEEEFWWDCKDLEEEMRASAMGYSGEYIWSKVTNEDHRHHNEILLQEWYDIEKTIGIDVETHNLMEDCIGVEEREIIWAEWSLIEEELKADEVLNQHLDTHNQSCVERGTDKIHEIIIRARLEIQVVVKTAVQHIRAIQQPRTSFADLPGNSSTSGDKCVTQEDNFNSVIGCPSDDHLCSWEPWNILSIKSSCCIEPAALVVNSLCPGGDLAASEQNDAERRILLDHLERYNALLKDPYLFAGYATSAGLPHRWQWHGIQEKPTNWMPYESVGNHAHQRGVAWKRRRRKFHKYQIEIMEDAWTEF